MIDITESERAEDVRRQIDDRFRRLVEVMPVALYVCDKTGIIQHYNNHAVNLWGREPAPGDPAHRHCGALRLYSPDGELVPHEESPMAAVIRTGLEVHDLEVVIERPDGSRRTVLMNIVPLISAGGELIGAMNCFHDITDRKHVERELSDSYNQMRTLTGRLMRAHDDEGRRIARMLHETTAQNLAGLKMLLARLNRTPDRLSDNERSVVVESMSLAEQAMTEIRTLSYLLHPPFLDETGLLSALRWYAAGFAERSGINVEVELPESFERLPRDTETALFRIVQESLTNIHRHAGSDDARIRLVRDAETLVLEVHDRGHGIPDASLKHVMRGGGVAGVGIAGMRERIDHLGGRLDISSSGHGTTVRARLPLVMGAG